jgi:cell wall-associated NlpC family hydrolase
MNKIIVLLVAIVNLALQNLDASYVYGCAGPTYFDCSGLPYYCYLEIADIELPRSAYEQGYCDDYLKIETVDELQLGDLVFFNTESDGDLCDHSGIYLENREFVHASSTRGKVIISEIEDNYYEQQFSWGRRILSD